MNSDAIAGSVRNLVVVAMTLFVVTSAFAIVPMPVAAADPEGADSSETARSLSVATGSSVSVSGGLEAGDEDWYALEADRGEAVQVDVSRPAGESGRYVVLLRRADPDNPERVTTIPNGATIRDVRSGIEVGVGFVAPTDGTFYIVLRGDGGTYEFEVSRFETDSFEPNDQVADAAAYTVGTTRTGEFTYGDVEWFSFEADRGETVFVNASRPADEEGRYTVLLRQQVPDDPDRATTIPNGATIREVLPGETEGLAFVAPVDGTYFVSLLGSTGTWEFEVSARVTQFYEPNDGPVDAYPLFENPRGALGGGFHPGDQEWFSYDLRAGQTVDVTATRPADEERSYTVLLRQQDPDNPDRETTIPGGVTIREIVAGGEGDLGFEAPSRNTYYVAMLGNSGTFEADFRVDGEPMGLPNDRFERANPPVGNQDRANAAVIDAGEYEDLAIVDDDRDVFEIELSPGEQVRGTISFDTDANDLAIELTDDAGATVASGEPSTDGETVEASPGAGTYYLVVTGETGAATTYDLTITVEGSSPVAPYTDEDGVVQTRGLQAAVTDWSRGEITTRVLQQVVAAWSSGDPVDGA